MKKKKLMVFIDDQINPLELMKRSYQRRKENGTFFGESKRIGLNMAVVMFMGGALKFF
jgi:hypothetical protein